MPGEKPIHQDGILQFIIQNGNQAQIRRAKLLLLHEENLPTKVIAEQVGLSPSRVRHWLREYRSDGLSIFPPELIENGLQVIKTTPQVERATPPPATDSEKEISSPEKRSHKEMLVSDLCDHYQVDMAHARFVADLTLTLFDLTADIHQLPSDRRILAEMAGTLHNIGLSTDPEEHDSVGRNILLGTKLIGFDDTDRRILAFSTALHRVKYKSKHIKQEIRSTGLPDEVLHEAKTITALVRIADGLDYSADQSTRLKSIPSEQEGILISIQGPSAKENAARALKKSDMWGSLFATPINFVVDGEPMTKEEKPSVPKLSQVSFKKMKSPGVLPEDLMSEAGRKILGFHFSRMLKYESGTRRGEDIEALHDMRVATRRMRSAIPIFKPYFKKRIIQRFRKDLRRTGRALGRVRDLDVFMDNAQAHIESGEEIDPNSLEALMINWTEEREQAREIMLEFLESKRYQNFVKDFARFLQTEGVGVREVTDGGPSIQYVFQAVPQLIYQRDSVVRSYAHIIDDAPLDTLHSLRIDIKRFRYAMEFFEEVLGDSAKKVIKAAVKLQDHLGELHDADVACQILIEFLDRWRERDRRDQVNISGITHYLVTKQNELRRLVDTFPDVWEEFNSPDVRGQLAQAVSIL